MLDVAEGLNYLHANDVVHGNLKGVGIFFRLFGASPITLVQLNVFVDGDGHARLTDFEFASIVRGMSSITWQEDGDVTQPAPQIPEGTDAFTRESDVFAFSTVTIEVCPRALL